jgi:hypothetical protein
MALRTEYRSRDPDVLIAIILDRDAEIERLQTSLKTLGALLRGARSEKAGAVLEAQCVLDLGDLETGATPAAAQASQDGAAQYRLPAQASAAGDRGDRAPKHGLPLLRRPAAPHWGR